MFLIFLMSSAKAVEVISKMFQPAKACCVCSTSMKEFQCTTSEKKKNKKKKNRRFLFITRKSDILIPLLTLTDASPGGVELGGLWCGGMGRGGMEWGWMGWGVVEWVGWEKIPTHIPFCYWVMYIVVLLIHIKWDNSSVALKINESHSEIVPLGYIRTVKAHGRSEWPSRHHLRNGRI